MSKSTFGGTIKLTGEDKYRRALANINADLKVHTSELKAAAAQFDVNDKSVENLTKQNEVLNKSIRDQENKVKTLKDALAAAKAETGEESATTKKWQTELYNAEAKLGQLNRQLDANERDMKEAKEATDKEKKAVKDLGTEADGTKSKMEAFGKGMKIATAAVAAIGAASVAAGKKIWNMANDVAETGDEIDKMSQKIGISAESYQEWGYVFDRCGADVNNLQTGMKKLSDVIDDASKGSSSAAEKLAAVGLSIDDLNGKSQDQQLSIVIEALQKMEAGAGRTAAASDLFGKSSTDLAAVLNLTADQTAALKQEAQDYGMVMSGDAVKASAAFEDSLTKLKGTIGGVKNRMIGELLPGITKITDGLADLVAGNKEGSAAIKEGVGDVIESVNDMLPQALDLLTTIGTAILENASGLLETISNSLISQLPTLLSTMVNDVLPQLITGALSVIKSLFSTITKALPELMTSLATTLVELATQLFSPENIKETVGMINEFLKSVMKGLSTALPILIDGIGTLVTGIIESIPDIIDMLFNSEDGFFSAGNIMNIVNMAAQLVIKVCQQIPTIIKALIDAIPSIISGLFDPNTGFLSAGNIGKLVQGAVDVVVELVKHIPEIIGSLLSAIPGIISDIVNAFGDLVGRLFDVGKKAISALWDGLTGAYSEEEMVEIVRSIGGEEEANMIRKRFGMPLKTTYNGTQLKSVGGRLAMATGGVATEPTDVTVGDKGPEAIIPLKNNTEWIGEVVDQMLYKMSAQAALSAGRYAVAAYPAAPQYDVHISFGNVSIANDMDINDVAQKISRALASEVMAKGGAWR